MATRHQHMLAVSEVGKELIASGNFGSDKIQQRIDEVKQQWTNLVELADYRKKRLNEAVDYHQVRADGYCLFEKILTKQFCVDSDHRSLCKIRH